MQELHSQLKTQAEYIKRLEKRNGQLEKQVIDQQKQQEDTMAELLRKVLFSMCLMFVGIHDWRALEQSWHIGKNQK